MDELDRMSRQLVATIRTRFPEYESSPFRIGEIYQTIIPYRHYRRKLGVETSADYDVAVARLIAGERGYLIADDDVRGALQRELRLPHPDESVFRNFADRSVSLAAPALALALASPATADSTAPDTPVPTPAPSPKADARVATPSAASSYSTPPSDPRMPPSTTAAKKPAAAPDVPARHSPVPPLRSTTASELGGSCRYCSGTLPDGRRITFCPHCGQDLTVQQCPACGTALEIGWKFCTTCGRSMATA